jgi:tetratricopeptide (TPR) repeat protein
MAIPKPNTSLFRPVGMSIWISRGLESLWLLTVVLVPIAFLDRDYLISEAVISYVEVPKVALLRTLVGMIAILWFIEWGIGSRLSLSSLVKGEGHKLRPVMWIGEVSRWLRSRPTRWLMVAVWFFLATTFFSTILSGSFKVSMWGEVPGQDGYPAYTVVAYVLLFGVIATHLKTKAQLWRLLVAVAFMGTMVAGYGIFQHYGHDFLGLTEITGGGSRSATSFMGNKSFSAAVMLLTIPITLLAGTMSLRDISTASGGTTKWLRLWMLTMGIVGLWAMVLAVQLLGITFTFARGPWVGSIAALLTFLVFTLAFAGWRPFASAAVLLALALALILAVLLWMGSLSTLGPSPGLGVLAALVGLGWVAAVLAPRRRSSQFALGLGLAAALGFTVILAMIWFRGGSADFAPSGGPPGASVDSTTSQVAERIGSVKREVLSGFGGRGTHWKVSWELIKDRPWFEFDNLSLPWLRPLIGYGPDLFRYTYLLRSPPEANDLLPLEPDHAHNFFIHQAVEQGILGLLSSLGIFVTVFVVGGYRLLCQSQSFSTPHKLILAGLLAVMAGRFLEMMVGVARVSDLTLLWVLLGVFAALPVVMESEGEQVAKGHALPASRGRRRRRRGTSSSPRASKYDWQLFWRLAIVAWLIGGVAALTWVKSINYVRAGVEEADGLKHFRQADLQYTLKSLDRATKLAPDVSHYYNNLGNVYLAYQVNKNVLPEQGCGRQDDLPYNGCLAVRAFQSNLEGVKRQPFYYRSRRALANSARNLPQLRNQTVQFYQETLAMVPASWPIRNELAVAYISAERPKEALQTLRESLDITKDTPMSMGAYFLLGISYRDLGDLGNSVLSMERSLQLGLFGLSARRAHGVLAEYYLSLGRFEQALASLDQLVSTGPDDAKSHASRGIAYSELGEYNLAVQDFEEALRLDPGQEVDYARLGKSYFELDRFSQAIQALDQAINGDPADARSLAYRDKAYDNLSRSDLIQGPIRGDPD